MMSGVIGGLMGGLAVLLVLYFNRKKAEKAEESETTVEEAAASEASAPAQPSRTTYDILLDALGKLQCEPEVEEEENGVYSIMFDFQAERFNIRVDKNSRFISLCDAFWYSFENSDLDQFSDVKKVINDINWQSQVNVCYTKSEENNSVNVHTISTVLCCEEGDFTAYLRHLLMECFVVHNEFYRQLAAANHE